MTATTQARTDVSGLHREARRIQLERDPITAARAAQAAGQDLADALRIQCEWRGIDPAPYLAQLEETAA